MKIIIQTWGEFFWFEIDTDLKYNKSLIEEVKYKSKELLLVLFKKNSIFKKEIKDREDLDFTPEPAVRE